MKRHPRKFRPRKFRTLVQLLTAGVLVSLTLSVQPAQVTKIGDATRMVAASKI
jgi:hypothetical protein